jgi:hypothetical protein
MTSQQVSWWDVHECVSQLLDRIDWWPLIGTPEWVPPTEHHVGGRRVCGCGARVFTYAEAIDDTTGEVLRHLCSRCARVARGEPVCRICGELVDETAAGWQHVNIQRPHPAAPSPTL